MSASTSDRSAINQLHKLRLRFDPAAAAEKLNLLRSISTRRIRSASDLQRLHDTLCFFRAFPDSRVHYRKAVGLLEKFDRRVGNLTKKERKKLADSGVVGTPLVYVFSFVVAQWITRKFDGVMSIAWAELNDSTRLDELIEQLLEHSEADFYDSGEIDNRQWLALAASKAPCSQFDWLMRQLRERRRHTKFWTALYDACELPLRCELSDARLSTTGNVFTTRAIFERRETMQRRMSFAIREIQSPLKTIIRVSTNDGRRLIDVAKSSLVVRHRETIHFNYANPREVYVADVGRGIKIAVMGLLPDHRYSLETTMGYLVLSNGVPIGYGGSSVVFRQANTGINIFAEYRGAEAAWIWTQVMRVFHSLTGCTRYIANPYQIGHENTEALRSGAFWFYYRLGYRPVLSAVRKRARGEYRKISSKSVYRSPLPIMRKLVACDMHLTLPGARQAELFDERFVDVSSMLAMQELSAVPGISRNKTIKALAARVAGDLGLCSLDVWTRQEVQALERMAPIVAATGPAAWPVADKNAMSRLIRAKGGDYEVDYARCLSQHTRFFSSLNKRCKRALRD